jgi:hypothetical protein
MTERQNNNQNPSGIWQGIWANLFIQIFTQMTENNYMGAWRSIELLKVSIPPECEEDIQKEYEKTSGIINKPAEAYGLIEANKIKKNQLNSEAPPALLTLLGSIRKSLYNKHWINKDFSVQPLKSNSPHIRSDQNE